MSVVARFAAFRKKKDEADLSEKINRAVEDAFESKGDAFTKPRPNPWGSGGISSVRVAQLEARVKEIEDNPSGGLQYTQITDTGTRTLASTDFIFGHNIFGVNAAGPVTIRLPDTLQPGTLVSIKDESLNASTNNITIETYIEA